MMISRFEALKAVDDIFNYCEEIDHSLPENERSGYKMLPDIHKIRKYINENTREHGEWIDRSDGGRIRYPFWERYECSKCWAKSENTNFCPNCGSDNRKEGKHNEQTTD